MDKKQTLRHRPSVGTRTEGGDGALLTRIYSRLHSRYGPQHWWPGESRLEVILGAILTQATAWANVERALANLKSPGLISTEALRDIAEDQLAALLKPSGFFNAKARKLKAFIEHLWAKYDGDLELLLSIDTAELRRELLAIHGIGEETADDILLYAASRPSFVIDAYTRRIFKRLGLAPSADRYQAYQELFHRSLDPNPQLYNEYHALLDRHAKETCRVVPRCGSCCLVDLCPTAEFYVDNSDSANL